MVIIFSFLLQDVNTLEQFGLTHEVNATEDNFVW